MTDDLCEVIITAPDRDWLTDLCRQLVDAPRLLRRTSSIRSPASTAGKGEVHDAIEARAFLRSRRSLDDIVAYVVPRHPYEVPNVTAIPIVGGNRAYLDWVRDETERD